MNSKPFLLKQCSFPHYIDVDKNSGRCRINSSTMKSFGINIGDILIAKTENSLVPVTAWPDIMDILENNAVQLDVNISTYSCGVEKDCEVVKIVPSKTVPSLFISISGSGSSRKEENKGPFWKAKLMGFAVNQGLVIILESFTIRVVYDWFEFFFLLVDACNILLGRQCSGMSVGVVGPNTIVTILASSDTCLSALFSFSDTCEVDRLLIFSERR